MSECTDAGDTMRVFDCLMPNVGAGDMAEHERSRERTAIAMENVTLNSTAMDMSNTIMQEVIDEVQADREEGGERSISTAPAIQNSTKCNVDMDIGNETINIVTSETSFGAGDKLHTSEVDSLNSPATERSQIASRMTFQCPKTPANTTIVLDTETRTTDTKDRTGTINLFTTPDKSMISTRPEVGSVLLKSFWGPTSPIEKKGTHLPAEVTQNVTECEDVEVQRRAEVSCYPVEDHFAGEALLESKVNFF
ncbi:hypothetical protein COOONC_04405 [Cooperia oncophora]